MDQPRRSRGSASSQEDKSDASNRIVRSKVEVELHLLPLDILQYILSRLSVKEAVRMTILSCEWRRLRICHPDLVFTKDTFGSTISNTDQASEFIANVDNVLHPLWSTSTTTATTLNKFVVKYRLGRSHKAHIDRWISFSTASRAKHIGLVFKLGWTSSENDKYVLPLCNLSGPNGSCVESLDLSYVCLELPPSFCGIKNLKKLTLHTVSVNLSDFQCLLLSCALLESLNIEAINWLSQEGCSFQSLCIHQELCRLQDIRVRRSNLDMIELHASNLQKFDFDDELDQVVLNECLKLSEATFVSTVRTLEFDEYGLGFTFTELPTVLPHVHKLSLLLNVDQVLRFSDNQSHFMNLRYLNMNLEIFSYPPDTSWAVGLVNLLELAPLLEELELHLDADSSRPSAISSAMAMQGPLHRHLKSVYMSGFCDVLGLPELALYILGNATALKCMVVDPAAYNDLEDANIYSVSKGGSSKELPCHINQKRMFAQKNLDKEEFRHILTIL